MQGSGVSSHLPPPLPPLPLSLQPEIESQPASARPAIYSRSPGWKERREHVERGGRKKETGNGRNSGGKCTQQRANTGKRGGQDRSKARMHDYSVELVLGKDELCDSPL